MRSLTKGLRALIRASAFSAIIALFFTLEAHARSFYMGISQFSYDNTQAAVDKSLQASNSYSDMTFLHLDEGVPWTEAYYNVQFKPGAEAWLNKLLTNSPAGKKRFVTVTPLDFGRNSLAPYRGENPNEPLDSFWASQPFNSAAVKQAYLNYCIRIIQKFNPDFFGYVIEGNIIARRSPEKWNAYLELVYTTYVSLKYLYPQLPIFVTIQTETFYEDPSTQKPVIQMLMHLSDIMALSVYPYYRLLKTDFNDPRPANSLAALPSDHLEQVLSLSMGKPFGIAETGWPSEDIVLNGMTSLKATQADQASYLNLLFSKLQSYNGLFINWFLVADYDAWWDRELKYSDPNTALILRLWKDIGLFSPLKSGTVEFLAPKQAGFTWVMKLVSDKYSR